MTITVADRIQWAVNLMAIAPSDHLLEIGCGNGAAVSAVCERLEGGTITAIDQSPKMIALAERRNEAHIRARRARFAAAPLHQAELTRGRYNKIFAINVNVFWMDAARELDVVKLILQSNGTIYLFNQPPSANKLQQIADRTCDNLTQAGFVIRQTLIGDLKQVPGACVVAGLHSNAGS